MSPSLTGSPIFKSMTSFDFGQLSVRHLCPFQASTPNVLFQARHAKDFFSPPSLQLYVIMKKPTVTHNCVIVIGRHEHLRVKKKFFFFFKPIPAWSRRAKIKIMSGGGFIMYRISIFRSVPRRRRRYCTNIQWAKSQLRHLCTSIGITVTFVCIFFFD